MVGVQHVLTIFYLRINEYQFDVQFLCLSFFLEKVIYLMSDTVGDLTLLLQSADENVVIQDDSTLHMH